MNENVIAASKRPDGTLRKERRVRAGFVSAEDAEKYTNSRIEQSKVPAGYVPGLGVVNKPNSEIDERSSMAKRNARKRERRNESGADANNTTVQAVTTVPVETDVDKKLKALRKKLRQIEELEARNGDELLPEQKAKLESKNNVLKEISELEQNTEMNTVH